MFQGFLFIKYKKDLHKNNYSSNSDHGSPSIKLNVH